MYKQLNGLSTASLDSIKFVDQNVNIVAREKSATGRTKFRVRRRPNFGEEKFEMR